MELLSFGRVDLKKMTISYGEPNPSLFIKSGSGLKGKVIGREERGLGGLGEQAVWAPGGEGYRGGCCQRTMWGWGFRQTGLCRKSEQV